MPGDVLSGRYPLTAAIWKALGEPVNASQGNIPVRSTLEYTGFASIADGAAFVTNKLVFVPVPVEVGDIISTVTIIAGATSPTTTIGYSAVYSGLATAATAALLAQSANLGGTQIAASAPYAYTLASKILVTPANAPFGYLYVGIQQTGTCNSAASVSIAAAVSGTVGAWFTNGPVSYCSTVAATTATAPPTLATPTAATVAPVVFLS